MADFVQSGWGIFIAAAVLISIAACFWLAWNTSRARIEVDADGQVGTTGHVWDDDLEELNNPLPRWWLYLFYMTCIFGVLYLLLYPGLGAYQGLLGWTSGNQYDSEIETAAATYDPLFEEYLSQDLVTVAANPAALEMGERLYLTYCSQCHGSTANGGRSFPNLADQDWLGSGEPEYIKTTILNGRNALMPPMGAALGGDEGVEAVANYVLSLSDSNHDAALAEQGSARFAVCAACHGADGAGNPVIGAPNLTDDIWLYGGSIDSIKHAINNGLQNNMPAFGDLLGEGKSHVLAAYIWSLSNDTDATAN
jgi:cytochrome c oxidase cbb3-type subunit 3